MKSLPDVRGRFPAYFVASSPAAGLPPVILCPSASADTLDINRLFRTNSAQQAILIAPPEFNGFGDVKKLSGWDYNPGPNSRVHDRYGGHIITESRNGALSTTDKVGYKASPTVPGWDIPGPCIYFESKFVTESDEITTDTLDITYLINYIIKKGPPPNCE